MAFHVANPATDVPGTCFIMENAINMEDMPEHYFASLFAVMYLGMAPLTSMAAIIRIGIMGANMLIDVILFVFTYKRSGLE